MNKMANINATIEDLKDMVDKVDVVCSDFDNCLLVDAKDLYVLSLNLVLDNYPGIINYFNVAADVSTQSKYTAKTLYWINAVQKMADFSSHQGTLPPLDISPKRALKKLVSSYNKLLKVNNVVPNPIILEMLHYAQDKGKFVVILSDALMVTICPSVKRWTKQGLLSEGLFYDIYAYDHKHRKGIPKVDCIIKFCDKHGISLNNAMMLEDTPNILESMHPYGIKGILFSKLDALIL